MVIDMPDRSDLDAASDASSAVGKAAAAESAAKVLKPAWQKPAVCAGAIPEPEPVMGAVSWPALADSRITKSSEAAQKAGPKPSAAGERQGSLAEQTIHLGAGGNGNSPVTSKHKSSVKRGIIGNGTPTFPAPAILPSITSSMGHAAPGANVVPSDQLVKGSGEMGTKAGLPSAVTADHGRVFHHRGEGNGFLPHNAGNRRYNTRDQGRGNYGWHSHGRGYVNGRDNGLSLQHRVGPRNLPRPTTSFINTNPGFAGFQNAGGGIYYMPAAPADPFIAATYFVPPGLPGVFHGPEPMALQAMLAKQIEYYFSIENLCRDIYLRSNMDPQGFIPVSVIANFNRVRMLTLNPSLILESLRKSTVVEIKGDRIRKRDDWAKWLLPSSQSSSHTSQDDKKESINFSIFPKNAEARLNGAVDDDCDGLFRMSSATLLEEKSEVQSKSLGMDLCSQPSYEGGGSDENGYAGVSERHDASDEDSFHICSSLQNGIKSAGRSGWDHDSSNCIALDCRSSCEGSSTVSHLTAEEETENIATTKYASLSTNGEVFQQDEQFETKHFLHRDPLCQLNSSIDENDATLG